MTKTLRILATASALAVSAAAADAATITTTFADNNGASGNMFDLDVGANDIIVEAFDLNLDPSTTNVRIYTRVGSFAGNENNAVAWTLLESIGGIVSAGNGNPTSVDVADFTLSASTTYGIFVYAEGAGSMNYTNGTGVGNVAATNADLTIYEGVGRGQDDLSYFGGGTFSPRIWNGTITYNIAPTAEVPLPAAGLLLVAGLAGAAALRRRR